MAAGAAGPLTDAQLQAFDRDGFLVLRGAIPPEVVREHLAALEAVAAAAERDAEGGSGDGGAWDGAESGADSRQCTFAFERAKDGGLRRPARMHKAQGIALRLPKVLELVRRPDVALAAAALAGRCAGGADPETSRERHELDVFGTKYFPVKPGSPGSVSWHDDNYYFGTTRSHTISCVFYLRGTENGQGALKVVPGSHRSAEVGYERARHYRTLVEQHGEYIPEEVISSGDLGRGTDGSALPVAILPVPSGSVVMFDANLLHSVQPNLSTDTPSERVACHFIPGDLDTGFRGTSFRRGHFADRHLIVHADGRVATEDDADSAGNGRAEEAAAKRPRNARE